MRSGSCGATAVLDVEAHEDAEAFGVSIFGKGQGDLTRKLASRDRATRVGQVVLEVDHSGALFIEDAAAWPRCWVYAHKSIEITSVIKMPAAAWTP